MTRRPVYVIGAWCCGIGGGGLIGYALIQLLLSHYRTGWITFSVGLIYLFIARLYAHWSKQ